jgi:hypothetical protein
MLWTFSYLAYPTASAEDVLQNDRPMGSCRVVKVVIIFELCDCEAHDTYCQALLAHFVGTVYEIRLC